MTDVLEMYRKTLEFEGKMKGTPDSCTISRALELIVSAYQLGCKESDEKELRERYAGLAMQAMISNDAYLKSIGKRCSTAEDGIKLMAEAAVLYSDALIEELRREEKV